MFPLPLQVADVFPGEPLKVIGECWELIKRPKSTRSQNIASLRSRSYAYMGIPAGTQCYKMCDNQWCVHPEHFVPRLSPVGRMLYVRKNSEPRGDCRIWTGRQLRGQPAMHVANDTDTRSHSTVFVRAFVMAQEYVTPPRPYSELTTACDPMCVEPTHILINGRPHGYVAEPSEKETFNDDDEYEV